ncbi:hypothetical protein OOT46_29155 [Aquabacterium sp. A7-Y]|uniref:hypothetical protein n=1 Tax=Aquabacterium sp. A7-Y TaxID=1349605 RepID=UPI00223DB68D|nr:hypothetical protein [Aquabacterium sp. A7-Y]MCW7541870.1 hypothetical protein [Aquabacterium sp. A7-Y]
MAGGMIRTMLKIIGVVAIVLVAATAALVWKIRADDCSMFSDSFTKIKTITIDGKAYYIYREVSGFQDKVTQLSLSAENLPESVCDYSKIKNRRYPAELDEEKFIKKLVVTRKSDASFNLEVIYDDERPPQPFSDFAYIPVEVNGKLQ